jgi:hypothetical protein
MFVEPHREGSSRLHLDANEKVLAVEGTSKNYRPWSTWLAIFI